jgi:phage terminase small subunit
MPQLLNARHERFAAMLAEGKSASEAHELAGYRPNRHSAWKLNQRDDIKARVSELLAERQAQNAQATAKAVEELAITKEWVLAKLKENAINALKVKGGSPVANRALELLGKELGMFIDRAEISQANEFGGMSLDEMRVELVARARRLGLDRELAGLLEGPADQDADDPGLN